MPSAVNASSAVSRAFWSSSEMLSGMNRSASTKSEATITAAGSTA